ncbi:flagellar motor protein MotB [Roseovarius sp.]|jgi:chemotaxis protein MotB
MAASGDNAAPVIIKRKKVISGDGHHGGAWKVAYADFVTAMMAFFLLMWLLNATTEKQRKGIADYFSPTVPINRISGGGDGNFGGESVFSEMTLPQNGNGATNQRPADSSQSRGETGVSQDTATASGSGSNVARQMANDAKFDKVQDLLKGQSGESAVSPEIMRHILTRVTDEGLVIELFDLKDARLFMPESHAPTPLLLQLAQLVVTAAQLVENEIAIEGHTRARPVVVQVNPVWTLSMARADAMRNLMQDAGIRSDRMSRVTGHADREPVLSDKMALRNNRLEVILLRSDD